MSAHYLLIPTGARETFVPVEFGWVRVLTGGDATVYATHATPALLIHGGGSDNAAISWYRLFGPCGERRRVIVPDLPGFGYTKDVAPSENAAGMADHLAALLDALGVDRVIVCGVSMGGEVAIQLALRHPARCTALIAIAPGGLIDVYKNPLAHTLAWLATHST